LNLLDIFGMCSNPSRRWLKAGRPSRCASSHLGATDVAALRARRVGQYSCRRYRVDKLLIELEASGISATQEPRKVTGDKVARALAVQPLLSNGMVYAPVRDWSEGPDDPITEASMFPKGKRDDLTDITMMALKYLRDFGLAQNDDRGADAETGVIPVLTVAEKPNPVTLRTYAAIFERRCRTRPRRRCGFWRTRLNGGKAPPARCSHQMKNLFGAGKPDAVALSLT
jgi:hypothetical protein